MTREDLINIRQVVLTKRQKAANRAEEARISAKGAQREVERYDKMVDVLNKELREFEAISEHVDDD